MLKGVLLGFACYAAYSISDAFVKLLEGTLPVYEVLFLGALLMLGRCPFEEARRPPARTGDGQSSPVCGCCARLPARSAI